MRHVFVGAVCVCVGSLRVGGDLGVIFTFKNWDKNFNDCQIVLETGVEWCRVVNDYHGVVRVCMYSIRSPNEWMIWDNPFPANPVERSTSYSTTDFEQSTDFFGFWLRQSLALGLSSRPMTALQWWFSLKTLYPAVSRLDLTLWY